MSNGTTGSPPRLTELDEVLLRQVHPEELDEAVGIQSLAFRPGSSHGFLLSTLREAVGPETAFERHVTAGLESAGTWGVSVGEAEGQSLVCLDDADPPDTPEDHASIDFNVVGRKQQVRAARGLRDAALARGRMHPLPSDEEST